PPLVELLVAIAPLIPPLAQLLTAVLVPAAGWFADYLDLALDRLSLLGELLSGQIGFQEFLGGLVELIGRSSDFEKAIGSMVGGLADAFRAFLSFNRALGLTIVALFRSQLSSFRGFINGIIDLVNGA